MFNLLNEPVDFQTLNRPANIEYHRIFDTVKESGTHHFLHGVAVEQYKDRLVACFAFNEHAENTISEKLLFCWSSDNGITWSKATPIVPPQSYANSHSVLLSQSDSLWCFGPRFRGLGSTPYTKNGHPSIHFQSLQMEAWKYDGCSWQSEGIIANDFWPLGAPTLLSNGTWMIAGCDTYWKAAIAISLGNDLLHWNIVKPDTQDEVFTEAGAWGNGNEILMVMRNESAPINGKYHAVVSRSTDFGRTFSPCELSNLPIATSKPFCGNLNDGRPYIVFNESIEGNPRSRTRMLLGICKKETFVIDKLYVVDEGYTASCNRRLGLSYPYAAQIDNRLYVAYSYESAPGTGCNHNDAMLAVIDIACLH